jgi:hypothetical protein
MCKKAKVQKSESAKVQMSESAEARKCKNAKVQKCKSANFRSFALSHFCTFALLIQSRHRDIKGARGGYHLVTNYDRQSHPLAKFYSGPTWGEGRIYLVCFILFGFYENGARGGNYLVTNYVRQSHPQGQILLWAHLGGGENLPCMFYFVWV